MDELSNILKEAKPLYFKRKRAKKIVTTCVLAMLPVIIFSCVYLPFANIQDSQPEVSYYSANETSVIEEMGFPTDDYGLLKVD